jgi:hypothetical protein
MKWRLSIFSGVVGLAAAAAVFQSVRGDTSSPSADPAADVAAAVASGEFSVALDLANQIEEPTLRDQALAEIATAQRNGGARHAATKTAGMIRGDVTRSMVLANMSNPYQGFGSGPGIGDGPQGDRCPGGAGGITEDDFEDLIELIEETIEPDSWETNGGTGRMRAYPSGVYVDAQGTLVRLPRATERTLGSLRDRARVDSGNREAQAASPLRKVSLTRLERMSQLAAAEGRPPTEAMRYLAGLYEIRYVLVYPDTGDIVIAGPAGAWHFDNEGRAVNSDTGRPVLVLDDLVVALRNAWHGDGQFGCSIEPRADNLTAFQEFLVTTKLTGNAWREQLGTVLGQQDILVNGIDARTHAGRVLVEADYLMKLVGMGLADTVRGVPNYFDRLDPAGGAPPENDVVRWWFTMNYDGIWASAERDAFELRGQGVKVLSESEMLDERGQRVHTGRSSAPTAGFAADFTRNFPSLVVRYPVFGELKNLFDLSLVAAVIRNENLAAEVGWHLTWFDEHGAERPWVYTVATEHVPRQVASVVNDRVFNRREGGRTLRTTVVGVSGGVEFTAASYAASDAIKPAEGTDAESLAEHRGQSRPVENADVWWWD